VIAFDLLGSSVPHQYSIYGSYETEIIGPFLLARTQNKNHLMKKHQKQSLELSNMEIGRDLIVKVLAA
jgi:hypothetical protein